MTRAENLLNEEKDSKAEMMSFMKTMMNKIQRVMKELESGKVGMNAAGAAHRMAGVSNENWYRQLFK